MLPRLVLAAILLGHAAIHAGYLSPRPTPTLGGPAWPFDLAHSWILSPLGVGGDTLRILGVTLFALVPGIRADAPDARQRLIDYLVENFHELVYV